IVSAAKTVANGLMSSYDSSSGLFQSPTLWYQTGAIWGGLADYWHYTGDDQYNSIVAQGILSQAGGLGDFLPVLEALSEVRAFIKRIGRAILLIRLLLTGQRRSSLVGSKRHDRRRALPPLTRRGI